MARKCCRPHPIRRPVCFNERWRCADVQGRLPVCWCEQCGGEVFEWARLCLRCAKEERT